MYLCRIIPSTTKTLGGNYMSEKKIKKPFYKKWWFIAIVVIVVIGFLGNMGNKPTTTTTTTDSNQSADQPKQEVGKEWKEVTTFEGESIKDTETFHIEGKEWRIVWSTEPGSLGDMNFQIYVYKDSDTATPVSIAANVVGKGNDTSTIRGSGDYYFTINTGQPYKIVVEEYK